jgi:hypothetical protein
MGNLSKIVGGHDIKKSSDVLTAVADQVDPTRPIDWTTSNPTVRWQPTTSTIAEADQAEKEASEFEAAVNHGVRLLKAETKKQKAHTKLVSAHRQYLGQTAQAHFEAASANRGLAGKLHGLREGYAQLGYSLERKEQVVTAKVDQIKQRLLG